MVITSRSRKLVIDAPIGILAFSVGWGLLSSGGKHPAGWKGWIVPGILVLVAILSFRVIRRVGRHIFISYLFLGRQRLEVSKRFLTVTLRSHYRGATNDVELVVDDHVNLVAPSTWIASYSSADPDKAARAAGRIAEALDLPPPRLSFSLPTSEMHVGPKRRKRPFGRSRWFTDALIGLSVLGVTSAVLVRYRQSHTDSELYLRCRSTHAIKLSIGQLTLTGSTGFTLPPGDATVEVWDAALGCWTQRTLTLKKGVKTILDLDELAALHRCDRRGSPPP